nr:phage protease [Bartonella vinsonii]
MATKKIISREYRYLSPEFRHSKKGEILNLAGAGLVNRPALVMTALSREQPLPPL